jgi:hypothetical protein
MATQNRAFPFRFVFPTVQLLLCLVLLWPVRIFLFAGISQSIHSYFGPAPVIRIDVPIASVEEQTPVDPLVKLLDTRELAPVTLDFPVLIAQLPYILLSPSKREWVPRGMFPDIWRALSWPFAGMFFWWFLGKGVEALSKARRSVAYPRIGWVETLFALILFSVGVVALIGILTSTQDDRRDIHFIALVAGALLWGFLATAPIAARFLQWRIAKRSAADQSTA